MTLPIRNAQIALLLIFVGTLSLSIGLNLLLSITGIVSLRASAGAGEQARSVLTGNGLPLSILIYGIGTPLIEEFVFRGILYNGIYQSIARKTIPSAQPPSGSDDNSMPYYDPKAAIAIIGAPFVWPPFLMAATSTSLLFGLYHGNLAQGIYAFLMGMAFCLSYELTGQFLSAWILHAACNIIALILSSAVNGTNAFTQLCTWPWTATFLAITIVSYVCLYQCCHRKDV